MKEACKIGGVEWWEMGAIRKHYILVSFSNTRPLPHSIMNLMKVPRYIRAALDQAKLISHQCVQFQISDQSQKIDDPRKETRQMKYMVDLLKM